MALPCPAPVRRSHNVRRLENRTARNRNSRRWVAFPRASAALRTAVREAWSTGIPVGSGRDRGKSNGRKLQLVRNADAFAMATCQRLFLAALAAAPDRTDGVNNVPCCEPPGGRGHRLARGKLADAGNDLPAGFQDRRSSRTMNGAIHASAAEQRRVGRIHDGVGLLARDIGRTCDHQDAVAECNSQDLRGAVHAG